MQILEGIINSWHKQLVLSVFLCIYSISLTVCCLMCQSDSVNSDLGKVESASEMLLHHEIPVHGDIKVVWQLWVGAADVESETGLFPVAADGSAGEAGSSVSQTAQHAQLWQISPSWVCVSGPGNPENPVHPVVKSSLVKQDHIPSCGKV